MKKFTATTARLLIATAILTGLTTSAQATTPEQIKQIALQIRAKWQPRKAWLTAERNWLRAHHTRCSPGYRCPQYQRRLMRYKSRSAAYKKACTKYYWLKKQYYAMIAE